MSGAALEYRAVCLRHAQYCNSLCHSAPMDVRYEDGGIGLRMSGTKTAVSAYARAMRCPVLRW
eukprot:948082-Rhodomonas_salina.2